MRASNFDLFDPTTLVMDSDFPPEDGCDHGDFAFAFNDSNFSDRILHIYIYSERIDSTQSPSGINRPPLSLFFFCRYRTLTLRKYRKQSSIMTRSSIVYSF
ncbi:hypothetical protein HanRHA438_Chr16g0781961 [Helianthus annuus]|nr:hypothetical protein HanRHA438_Chr16g0781961 [Helianthus annuus]